MGRIRPYKMRGICACGSPCVRKGGRCRECFRRSGYNANKMEDALDRFVIADSGCWEWVGNINPVTGYGRFPFNGHNLQAHRVIYELLVGPIPKGLEPDHLCRNRKCVNPSDLEPVTRLVNLLRGDTVVAKHVAKTHCPKGHEYNEVNTYWHHRMRHCRVCHKEAERLRRGRAA